MTCDYCARQLRGTFNWHCNGCRARWYLRQPASQQGHIAGLWRREMDADRLADVQRLIEQERAKA